MNKLYDRAGNLIGYQQLLINISKDELIYNFKLNCYTIRLKLIALGINTDTPESREYYKALSVKYGLHDLEYKNGNVMFKSTAINWVRNPVRCNSMFRFNMLYGDVLKHLNTSFTTDMSSMFGNTRLADIDFYNISTVEVENMTGMFESCVAVNQILDMSNFDTSKVLYMKQMFKDSGLHEINVSSFNTVNVIDMSEMFCHTVVDNLDLSSFNTSRVKNMDGMFYGAKINNLDISSFDVSKSFVHLMFCESKIKHIKINKSAYDCLVNNPLVFSDDTALMQQAIKDFKEAVEIV